MTRQARFQDVIEAWMTAIVYDGGIARYDDLHIDRINHRWGNREHWVSGGLEAFQIAQDVRDRHRLALTVAVAYSLESGEEPLGINFRTPGEFEAQLDWSPPSLYVFNRNAEPWALAREVAKPIDVSSLSAITPPMKGCFYLEFKPSGSTEYSRTVFVMG